MLPQRNRLKIGHKDLLENGSRLKTKHFIIVFRKNGITNSRFAIITTKKIGIAVVRNRIRRIIKQIIRENLFDLCPGYDVIIILSYYIKNWKDIEKSDIEGELTDKLKNLNI